MAGEPPKPILLPGVHAYAEKSVAAGEFVNFRVSSDVPHTLTVVRLGRNPDSPAQDEALPKPAVFRAHQQPISPGSYVTIESGLPPGVALQALTLECWVRIRAPDAWQGLITQYSWPYQSGFGLFVDPAGRAAIYLGDGGAFDADGMKTGPPLAPDVWHHLVAVWDGRTVSLSLDGKRASEWPFRRPVRPGATPLRLGAYGDIGRTAHFLDGDLAMPVVYGRALTAADLQQHFAERALRLPDLAGALGCWPFNEERGDRVADVSGNRRHGRIVNHATWMIGGPSFDAGSVPRFGRYEPIHDKFRGHALRFASDDLYDCGWDVTHSYRIPEDAKPGVYVGRIGFGVPSPYDVTFIVRRAGRRPRARLAVLCATNTWLAYNATPFAENWRGVDPRRQWHTGGMDSPAGAPAYSLYVNHARGQPTYHVGVHLPWPVAAPYILYGDTPGVYYSHLLRAERFAHIWLEEHGYDFDVITDFDLHADPAALQGRDVLLINGHSEYWSTPAYQAVERFLRDGGSVVVLSGNTMFWRVTFDDALGVMECRKLPVSIGGRTDAVGEIYHGDDGRRGGLMREAGYPASALIGVEFLGYSWTRPQDFALYRCERPEHVLFNSPRRVGLGRDEAFGGAPNRALPRAVGHEWDVRITSNPQINEAYKLPDEPPGIETLARCRTQAGGDMHAVLFDYAMSGTELEPATISEIIYWERPSGGRVFCVGSIAAGWGLSGDGRMQILLSNVLHHFGINPTAGRSAG